MRAPNHGHGDRDQVGLECVVAGSARRQVVHVTESAHAARQDRKALTLGDSEESFRLIVETIPGLIAVMTAEGEVEHSP